MSKAVKVPKPRNPYALLASQRQAGAHDKREKVKRRDARQALRKAIQQGREVFSPLRFLGWLTQCPSQMAGFVIPKC